MSRKTKIEIVAALAAAGFKVTSNRKEGKTEYVGPKKLPFTLRWIEVLVPGSLWSRADGDWCRKRDMRANERWVIAGIRAAVGKEAHFDLIDHDMGHSSTGEFPDDAHLSFYAYTAD